VRAALRAARHRRWDAVLATTPPPTATLVGREIARRLGLPLVLDFRDPWTRYYAAPHRLAPLAALERRLEVAVFRAADAAVMAHPSVRLALHDALSAAERRKIAVVPNGYDEEDFRGVEPAVLPEFSIVYTGQMRRSPRPLWSAVAHALAATPEWRGHVHVWFVGAMSTAAAADLTGAPDGVTVHVVPHVPPREAIRYMLGADLLFVDGVQDIVPSKALQYLRAGRPILALLDMGTELKRVIEDAGRGRAFFPTQVADVGDFVREIMLRPRRAPEPPTPAIARYSRRELAGAVAGILSGVVEARRAGRRYDAGADGTGMPD